MVYGARYRRKRSRMSKRARKAGVSYRKRYTRKSKFGRTGFFKVMRWSNLSSTANCHAEILGSDTLPSTDGATVFSLNNVAGSGELVALFDNYRITRVMYRWVLVRDPSSDAISTQNRGLYPRICWAHDFNDQFPLTRTQLYQRANLREAFMGDNYQKTRWYSLKPASLVQMYESSTATAYQPKWLQWMDTGDQAAPHYGIKYNIDQNYSGMAVRLEAKICMELKGIS